MLVLPVSLFLTLLLFKGPPQGHTFGANQSRELLPSIIALLNVIIIVGVVGVVVNVNVVAIII